MSELGIENLRIAPSFSWGFRVWKNKLGFSPTLSSVDLKPGVNATRLLKCFMSVLEIYRENWNNCGIPPALAGGIDNEEQTRPLVQPCRPLVCVVVIEFALKPMLLVVI